MKHELWEENNGKEYTFCLAGSEGDKVRSLLSKDAKLIWTCNAESHFDAMTKYYKYMGYGKYTSDFKKEKIPYSELKQRKKSSSNNG